MVLLITLLTYLTSLQNGWTNWDDPTYVLENPAMVSHDWSSLATQPFSLNFHPITMLSLGFDHLIWGEAPFGYHLSNLLLHLLATVLVFFLVRKLAPDRSWLAAAFASLLFGIHPMHVESVAWISERKDVLYVSFFLAGLISYLYYLKKLEWKWLLLTFILFFCSVLSKAMAVVFPVVLLLIDWYQKERSFNGRVWLGKIPFFLVSVIFGLMAIRIQSQGAIAQIETFTLFQRLIFASYGLVMYLVKAMIPYQMAAFYPYPTADQAASFFYYILPIIAIALILFPLLLLRKERTLIFGMFFYLITVALVLQFLSVGEVIMADRYTYLPYVGIFFAMGYYLDKWAIGKRRVPVVVGAGAFALLMAIICFYQISVWKDSEKLWTQVIRHFPGRVDGAYANRASFLGKNGRLDEGLADAEKAISINPHNARALSTRANILGIQGQFEAALNSFNRAIEEDPEDYKFYQNRGIVYLNLGRGDEAYSDFSQAIELSQGRVPIIITTRGILQINRGRSAEGLQDCMNSYQQQPNDANTNYCLALANLKLGNIEQARSFGQRSLQFGYNLPEDIRRQLGI